MPAQSIPAVYLHKLLAVLDERQIPHTGHLKQTGQGQIRFGEYAAVLQSVLEKTELPALGFLTGARVNLSDLDAVGYGCISSATWLDALHYFVKFQSLIGYGSRARLSVRSNSGHTFLRLDTKPGLDPRTERYLVDEWLGSWRHWLGATGARFTQVRLTAAHSQDSAIYERLLGCDLLHSQPANEIQLATPSLQRPLAMANSLVHSMMTQHCETRLTACDEQEELVAKVRREVEALAYTQVDSGRIADRLCISTRTVRRNLAHGGTSFHDVVMEQRMSLAKRYLTDPSVPIKQISSSLGYSEISSFHRAFRQHTGLTPGQYRVQHRA